MHGGGLSTGGAPRTLHTLELDLFAWFSLGKMVALDPKKADYLRSLPEQFLPEINKELLLQFLSLSSATFINQILRAACLS